MKISRFFAAFAAVAALFACKPDEQPVDKISATPSSVTFASEGGTIKVAVSADQYQVEGAAAWLTAVPNGKELELVAEANTEKQVRNCTLTLTAGAASCKLEVSQKAGSPYLGYKLANSIAAEYSGNSLYMFAKPLTENYGGLAFLNVVTEDETVSIMFYTDLFASEEEVCFPAGTYTMGEDDYGKLVLMAVPGTICPGSTMEFTDDEGEVEEVAYVGTTVTYLASDEDKLITEGTMTIEETEGGLVIKLFLVDQDGNVLKIVYEGKVEIDTEGAGYPGETERLDPTENIFKAVLTHTANDEGGEVCELTLYAGEDEENCAMTVFSYNVPMFFPDDLSGNWIAMAEDGEEEEAIAYAAEDEDDEMPEYGTANLGVGLEIIPGFILPTGSYVIYGIGDSAVADLMVSIVLEKNDDGTYTLNGVLMGSDMMHFYFDKVIDIIVEEGSDENFDED